MQEGTNIPDHLNVFNTLICQFINIGVEIEEEDKVVLLLHSLLES